MPQLGNISEIREKGCRCLVWILFHGGVVKEKEMRANLGVGLNGCY